MYLSKNKYEKIKNYVFSFKLISIIYLEITQSKKNINRTRRTIIQDFILTSYKLSRKAASAVAKASSK